MNPIFVSKLFSFHFRNLESAEVNFHPKLNVLFGENGQGKTNFLEAISIALSTKPLRSVNHVSDLIRHDCLEARVHVECSGIDVMDSVVWLSHNSKKYELDGKSIRDSSSLLRRITVVSFVPEDLQIVSASSSFRRRALNQIASGFFPNYLGTYRKFEKALASRNQLLKSPYLDPRELESFNRVFSALACEITSYREDAVSLWQPFFIQSIKEILGDKHEVWVNYVPSASRDPGSMHEDLSSLYSEERLRRSSLLGPQLDELEFLLDGQPTRFVASRGQARAIVLALKIAQLNALIEIRKMPTILLLDDVAGELDPHRVGHLLQVILKNNIQTLLTTTHVEGAIANAQASFFEIKGGQAFPCKNPGGGN